MKELFQVEYCKVKAQSINDVNLPARASNKLRGFEIRLGYEYVCDDTNDETLGNIYSRE